MRKEGYEEKNIDLSHLTQESWPNQRNALVELFGT